MVVGLDPDWRVRLRALGVGVRADGVRQRRLDPGPQRLRVTVVAKDMMRERALLVKGPLRGLAPSQFGGRPPPAGERPGLADFAAGQTADAIAVLEPVKELPQAAGLITCAEIVLDPTLDPELAAALERLASDPVGALEAMLEVLPGADADRKDRVRRVMIGVFAERPVDDPIVLEYRKRLARALN